MIRGLDPKFQVFTAAVTRTAGYRSSLVSRRTPAVRVGGALPLGPAAPALPVMGSGPASLPADPPKAACTQPSLLSAHCCPKRSSETGRAVTTPRASVCGAGMCSAGPVQAQRRPLAICPPQAALYSFRGEGEEQPQGAGENRGWRAFWGSCRIKGDTRRHPAPQKVPRVQTPLPGRRATEKAPASPSREPVTLSLAEPDTPFSCPVFALCRLTPTANPNRSGILECSLLLKS